MSSNIGQPGAGASSHFGMGVDFSSVWHTGSLGPSGPMGNAPDLRNLTKELEKMGNATKKAAGDTKDFNESMIKLGAVMGVATTVVKAMASISLSGAITKAAAGAASRGELAKATSLRTGDIGVALSILGAIPVVGSAASSIHKQKQFAAGAAEQIEMGQILDKRHFNTIEQVNKSRALLAQTRLQTQYMTPASRTYQQRMLGLKIGVEERVEAWEKTRDVWEDQKRIHNYAWKRRQAVRRKRSASGEFFGSHGEYFGGHIIREQGLESKSKFATQALEKHMSSKNYYTELKNSIIEQKRVYGELFIRDFYSQMSPQTGGHYGTFARGTMPKKAPEASKIVSGVQLLHVDLQQILQKITPQGKGA